MKKNVAFLMLPILAGLVGCHGTSGTTSSATKEDSTSQSTEYVPQIDTPTEITLWSITGKNNQAQLQNYIDEFQQLEPKVKVNNVIQTGMGYNELKEAVVKGFSADNYPDIVQCYPDHVAEYINYGKAVKLDSYIDNKTYGWTDEDKQDIYQAFITEGQEYTVEGTYSVPYCKSTEAMYYNEDVLIGLNLSMVDASINGGKPINKAYIENLTWEELFGKFCPAIISLNNQLPDNQKILKEDQDYHAVFAYDSDDNLFITLAKQYGIPYTSVSNEGKGVFDFGEGENKEKMATLLSKWSEYAQKGYIISKGSAGDNYTNAYFNKQNTLFSVGSTGGFKYQFDTTNPMNVGVAPIPHAEGNSLYTINQGPSLAILDHNDENRKLASWLLYKTITNKDNALDWAVNSGYMGIRKSSVESDEYQDASDTSLKGDKTLDRLAALNMEYSGKEKVLNSLYVSPAFVGSSTARTQVGGVITTALTKNANKQPSSVEAIKTAIENAYNQSKLAAGK